MNFDHVWQHTHNVKSLLHILHFGLTEKTRQPLRLFVMYDGYTESVEGHQTQDNPVEGVSLHHTANGDP